ncbi:MAG TPA: amino acid adenylation domain-containing protein, partial [Thermoanaerobaculia bacterium]|nr:amino acid adenylation domain-containing protein [Thermoanaerobaculia bacterium]
EAQPRTPVEEIVSGIFAEVLQLDRVGIHDDFFDLGGHSLLGIQVVSQAEALFGVELPLGALFENSTVARLSTRLEELQALNRGPLPPPIVPVPRGEELPLSFAQERLWFLDQLDPGMATYNLPIALGLRGSLEPGALQWSLSELVRRHEVLRTRYVSREGRPLQVIDAAGPIGLPLVDLRGLSRGVRMEEAKRLLYQEKRRPFDLAREHPLRAGLLRLEADRHAVWLTVHHISSDGWSLGILGWELSALYEARIRGQAPDLPELSVQYADFAVWQRGWLAGEELERRLSFWRKLLSGAPPLLELPLDRPRPPVPSFRGARVPWQLPRASTADLTALSRTHGATLFMVLLAGLSGLLSRVAQEDLVVGTVEANRNRQETQGLIGFFVSTLALRMKTSSDSTMADLILQAREVALESYAHQDLPFEKLVEELAPQRSRAHAPLFQILFVLQNAPEAALELPGLTPEYLFGEPEAVARFDLTVTAGDRADEIFGAWEYNRDLFDATTILRLVDHFRTLLGCAARQPACRLSDLPLLSDAQRQQLLVDWNDTAPSGEPAIPVHAQIALQARWTPDAVAAVHGAEHLTYRQLDERADRLAYRLREQGVGPEICVGICLDRSLSLLVGMLAILKAGGAYLPLDPAYPVDRLAAMLEDAFAGLALRLVLIDEGPVHDALVSRLPELRRVQPEAGTGGSVWPPDPVRPPAVPVETMESLAYVIYTSGSTGRPKGVAVTHRGLANLAASQRVLFEVGPGSKVLQFSSISFDASVSEIFVTLAAGACLCLADRQAMMPGPDLAGLLRDEEITVVTLPPSALALLPEEEYPALRTLVVAGEACPAELARRWARGRRMINAYGPTEATVCASAETVREGEPLSIGRAIDDTRLHVLDLRMAPVPIGVAGELYLSGPGLARGYPGRQELTAEAFVPDPFSTKAGGRLYRTGDRARRLPDGRTELLGRRDRQVKLRGFRIELGDVEAALVRHPRIGEATAVVQEKRTGDRHLVAYVVPRAEPHPTPAELRAFLRDLLPEFMVPSHFFVLERLPLLPNGKVDLRALALAGGRPGEEAARATAPRNPWESALAEVFAEILGLDAVGVEDNFFDLGGHSLLAVSLAARIEKRFGRKCPLAILFEGATVEQLAIRLFAAHQFTEWSPLVAMQPEGTKRPFFCVHPLGGGVTGYYRNLVKHLGPDQPVYGLRARGLEAHAGLRHPSIEEMASEYIAALRSVQPSGPYQLGGSSYGGSIAFEMAQQLIREGEEIAVLALIDARARPLETEGPPGEEDERPPDVAALTYGMARSLAALEQKELRLSFEEIQDLPEEDLLAVLLERLLEAGLANDSIDVPWLLRYRQSLSARIVAETRYRALPYAGRIDLFRTTGAMPEETVAEPEDPSLGWRAVARERVEIHWIAGTHQTMLLEPAVSDVAARLAECFARAAEGRNHVSST